MLSGFDDALAARLQRISPVIRATSASTISVTFRQKTPVIRHLFRLGPGPVADLRSLRLFQCRHQRIGRHAHQLPPIGSNFGALHHIDEENKVQGPWLTA
jgi:hypothetical protein